MLGHTLHFLSLHLPHKISGQDSYTPRQVVEGDTQRGLFSFLSLFPLSAFPYYTHTSSLLPHFTADTHSDWEDTHLHTTTHLLSTSLHCDCPLSRLSTYHIASSLTHTHGWPHMHWPRPLWVHTHHVVAHTCTHWAFSLSYLCNTSFRHTVTSHSSLGLSFGCLSGESILCTCLLHIAHTWDTWQHISFASSLSRCTCLPYTHYVCICFPHTGWECLSSGLTFLSHLLCRHLPL